MRSRHLGYPASGCAIVVSLLCGGLIWAVRTVPDRIADVYAIEQAFSTLQTYVMDHEGKLKWYRKAAQQGHARAQFNLGAYHDRGEGAPRDYAQALKWYRKAADQGDAAAQCNLGVCYGLGHGVPRDHAEAVKWYRKAAEQGDAKAQFNLGLAYAQGEGVAKDLAFAYKWLYIAGVRNADARARRQRLAQSMTSEQIAEGRRRSREWLQARTF